MTMKTQEIVWLDGEQFRIIRIGEKNGHFDVTMRLLKPEQRVKPTLMDGLKHLFNKL